MADDGGDGGIDLNGVLAGIAGFGAGFLGGMAAGAQITGPVGDSFPPWGGWFILGGAILGGIFGGAAGLAAAGRGRRRIPVKLPPTD